MCRSTGRTSGQWLQHWVSPPRSLRACSAPCAGHSAALIPTASVQQLADAITSTMTSHLHLYN
jgi:hypothetical protein